MRTSSPGPKPTPINGGGKRVTAALLRGKVLAAEIFRITFFKAVTFAATPYLNRACELRTLAIASISSCRGCTCSGGSSVLVEARFGPFRYRNGLATQTLTNPATGTGLATIVDWVERSMANRDHHDHFVDPELRPKALKLTPALEARRIGLQASTCGASAASRTMLMRAGLITDNIISALAATIPSATAADFSVIMRSASARREASRQRPSPITSGAAKPTRKQLRMHQKPSRAFSASLALRKESPHKRAIGRESYTE